MSVGVVGLAVLVASAATNASPAFPGAVREALNLPAEPSCSLCHQGPPSGATATSPFAMSARARGLKGSELSSVKVALDQMERDNVDSDGDGVPDVVELRSGGDPSATAGRSNVEATYGCISSLAPAPPQPRSFATLGVMVMVAALLLRRRLAR